MCTSWVQLFSKFEFVKSRIFENHLESKSYLLFLLHLSSHHRLSIVWNFPEVISLCFKITNISADILSGPVEKRPSASMAPLMSKFASSIVWGPEEEPVDSVTVFFII